MKMDTGTFPNHSRTKFIVYTNSAPQNLYKDKLRILELEKISFTLKPQSKQHEITKIKDPAIVNSTSLLKGFWKLY